MSGVRAPAIHWIMASFLTSLLDNIFSSVVSIDENDLAPIIVGGPGDRLLGQAKSSRAKPSQSKPSQSDPSIVEWASAHTDMSTWLVKRLILNASLC